MRYRIVNRIFRIIQWWRILFYASLSTGHSKGTVNKIQPILILGNGVIDFGKGVTHGYFLSPFFMSGYFHLEVRNKGALIKHGEDTHVNNNFVAIAEHSRITIGKRYFVGANDEIYSSDFHGVRVQLRGTSH